MEGISMVSPSIPKGIFPMFQAAMATPGVLEMKMKALDMKVRRAGADGATLENGSKLTMGAMDALCDHFRPLVAFHIRPGVGAPE